MLTRFDKRSSIRGAEMIRTLWLLAAFLPYLFITTGFHTIAPMGDLIRYAVLSGIFGLSLWGIFQATAAGNLLAALTSVFLLCALWFYQWLYYVQFGRPFEVFANGTYFVGTLVAFLYPYLRTHSFERAMRVVFLISIGYGILYVVLSIFFKNALLNNPDFAKLVMGEQLEIGRSPRILISTQIIAFGLMMSLAGVLKERRLFYAFAGAFFIAALILAQSRGFMAATAFVAFGYVALRSAKRLAIVVRCILLLAVLGTLYVAASDETVFLNAASPDGSERVRALSLRIAQSLIADHWALGVGLPSGANGYLEATGSTTFYSTDVGMLGVLLNFGIFGFAFYVLIAYFACNSWRYCKHLGMSHQLSEAVGLTGMVFTLYSLQSPAFFGTLFGSLYIALGLSYWERRRTYSSMRKQPLKGASRSDVKSADGPHATYSDLRRPPAPYQV